MFGKLGNITIKSDVFEDTKVVHILSCGHPRISVYKDEKDLIYYTLDTKTGFSSVNDGILELAVKVSKNFNKYYKKAGI